jgi:hypothetical protein
MPESSDLDFSPSSGSRSPESRWTPAFAGVTVWGPHFIVYEVTLPRPCKDSCEKSLPNVLASIIPAHAGIQRP